MGRWGSRSSLIAWFRSRAVRGYRRFPSARQLRRVTAVDLEGIGVSLSVWGYSASRDRTIPTELTLSPLAPWSRAIFAGAVDVRAGVIPRRTLRRIWFRMRSPPVA